MSEMHHVAPTTNTVSALLSGNPKRIARRGKNVMLGRALARGGFWQRLWR